MEQNMRKIPFRKKIMKYKMLRRLCVVGVEINNAIFYKRMCKKYSVDKKLALLKNMKKGERCFIVGNGPSLTIDDLELIKNEDCFAANLIFNIFDKTSWRPKYYIVQDRYADTGNAIDCMTIPFIFISDYYWRKRGVNNKNAYCFRAKRNDIKKEVFFSEDISKWISNMPTVTYSMIQIAVYLGYSEIYLIGMDHNYSLEYDKDGNVIKNEKLKSHFFQDRIPEDVIADIEAMNRAYVMAKKYADVNGIKIVNATRGGALDWFPRVDLENVVNV